MAHEFSLRFLGFRKLSTKTQVSDTVVAVSLAFQADFSWEAGAEKILDFKVRGFAMSIFGAKFWGGFSLKAL